MDTSDRSKLLAAHQTVEEISAYLACDSLAYLSLDGLLEATGAAQDGFCTACLSGNYPTNLPSNGHKLALEGGR
jgi:amidophosphoribosyltransferase